MVCLRSLVPLRCFLLAFLQHIQSDARYACQTQNVCVLKKTSLVNYRFLRWLAAKNHLQMYTRYGYQRAVEHPTMSPSRVRRLLILELRAAQHCRHAENEKKKRKNRNEFYHPKQIHCRRQPICGVPQHIDSYSVCRFDSCLRKPPTTTFNKRSVA